MASNSEISAFEESDTEVLEHHMSRGSPSSSSRHSSRSHRQQRKRTTSNHNSSQGDKIMKMLESLDNKMNQMDERIKKIEMTTCDKPQKKMASKPSATISDFVRRGYAEGLRKGMMWHFGKGKRYTDADNMEMTQEIKTSTIGMVKDAPLMEIAAASKRYFLTKSEASKRDENKHRSGSLQYQRRRQKAKRRCKAMEGKKSWSDAKKNKVRPAMVALYMSSEEDDDGVMVVRPLTWQSEKLKNIKKELDMKYLSTASKKSTTQMQPRRQGDPSTRPIPEVSPNMTWLLK